MAYKVFTNGSPLPASDLNTYLMNQSVMVFANSAARSAALSSPTEGMVTYLEDTNLLYVWTGAAWIGVATPSPITTQGDLIVGNSSGVEARLAIGANGTILQSDGTTASWAALPSPTKSWSLLNTGGTNLSSTITTVSSIGGYDDYLVILENAITSSTGGSRLGLRINTTTTNYFEVQNKLVNIGSGLMQFESSTADSGDYIQLVRRAPNNSSPANAWCFFSGGKSTGSKIFWGNGTPDAGTSANNATMYNTSGRWNNSATISSFSAIGDGTFTAGKIYVFGA